MRHRTRGAPLADNGENNSYSRIWYDCSNSSWTVYGGTHLLAVGDYATMDDVITPDYFKKRQRGEIVFNSMQSSRLVAERVSGVGTHRKSPTSINCSGVLRYNELKESLGVTDLVLGAKFGVGVGGSLSYSSLLSDEDIASLVVELSTVVQNARGRPDGELWEAIAEVDKSLSLLTDLFVSMRKMVTDAKWANRGKGLSAAWLAVRYGLQPLVNDVAGIVKGLEDTTGKRQKTSRAKGTLTAHKYETFTSASATVSRTIGISYSDDVQIRAMSLDEFSASVASNIGFSVKGLVTLPWELVRFSFVIDWFANIGNFLGALVPAVGHTQLGSAVTIERVRTINAVPVAESGGSQNWSILRSQTGTYKISHTSKIRTSGLPLPGLIIERNFKFSKLLRCLDALALLVMQLYAFRGVKRRPPRKYSHSGDVSFNWGDGAV